jgi:hypothetical protein
MAATTSSTAVAVAPGARRAPGDPLLHPVALAAVAVLLVDDLLLEPYAPGIITGLVSAVAGLVFFPLLALAVIEVGRRLTGISPWAVSGRSLPVFIALTAVTFIAITATRAGADATNLAALPALLVTGWVATRTIPPTG